MRYFSSRAARAGDIGAFIANKSPETNFHFQIELDLKMEWRKNKGLLNKLGLIWNQVYPIWLTTLRNRGSPSRARAAGWTPVPVRNSTRPRRPTAA
jgi:hypothetical protein